MMANPVLAQLLQWRPVPGFEPSAEAFAPNQAFIGRIQQVVADAVDRGQLHPDAADERGMRVLSILLSGVITQQLANEPTVPFDQGHYTTLGDDILAMFTHAYRP
jgi:hypothetical protein